MKNIPKTKSHVLPTGIPPEPDYTDTDCPTALAVHLGDMSSLVHYMQQALSAFRVK